MNIVTNFPVHCIHINYVSCGSITVNLKLEVWFWLKSSWWVMLVTFSVVDTSSVYIFNRKLTFAKDDLTLNEFFISKNVSVNTIVEIKVGSSMNSLCSVELSWSVISVSLEPVFFTIVGKNFFFSICDQIINFHAAFWGRFLRCGQVTMNK